MGQSSTLPSPRRAQSTNQKLRGPERPVPMGDDDSNANVQFSIYYHCCCHLEHFRVIHTLHPFHFLIHRTQMAPTADSLAHEFASHLEEGRAFDGRQPNGADERPLPDDQASMPDGIPLQSYEQAQTRSQHLRSWPPNSVGQRWAGKTQGTSEAEVRIKTSEY